MYHTDTVRSQTSEQCYSQKEEWYPHNKFVNNGVWTNNKFFGLVGDHTPSDGSMLDVRSEGFLPESHICRTIKSIIKEALPLCGIPDMRPRLNEALRMLKEAATLQSEAMKLLTKEIKEVQYA